MKFCQYIIFSVALVSLYSSISIGQIKSAIIGDEDSVAFIDFKNVSTLCSASEILGINFYGPYDFNDTGKFSFDLFSPLRGNVYFRPRSTDTVSRCYSFEVFYKEYRHECSGTSGRFSRCYTGYGISPDSLVLIRPKVTTLKLSPQKGEKNYRGVLNLNISNNTGAVVRLSKEKLFVDSASLIKIDSIRDSSGVNITSIPPYANKIKLYIYLSSRKGPVLNEAQYNSTLQFTLSRLGVDSVYSNSLSIILPSPDDLGVLAEKDSVVFQTTVGERVKDTLRFRITDSISNVKFDSLSYPFKITSLTKSDSEYIVEVGCGPATDSTYSSTVKLMYGFIGYSGKLIEDTISVALKGYVVLKKANVASLTFSSKAFEHTTRSFSFPIPTYVQFDSIKFGKILYPFRILFSTHNDDSTIVAVDCFGTGGTYSGVIQISYSINYYNDFSHQQKFYVVTKANIDNITDSIFWHPTIFIKPVSLIQANTESEIYAISDSFYISIDNGNSWMSQGKLPGIEKQLISDTTGLYLLCKDKKFHRSIDKGKSWVQLKGMLYMQTPNPPNCVSTDVVISPIDRIFRSSPPLDSLYASTISAYCHWPEILFSSGNNGETWNTIGTSTNGGIAWGKDKFDKVYGMRGGINAPDQRSLTSLLLLGAGQIASNATGIWKYDGLTQIWGLSSLGQADVRDVLLWKDSSLITIANGRGVYGSNDSGNTWYGLNGGLTTKDVTSITFDASRFWLGTKSSGIFYSNVIQHRSSFVTEKKSFIQPLIIYPNPASDHITIQTLGVHILGYELYDVTGRKFRSATTPEISESVDCSISDLPNGIFLVRLRTEIGSMNYRFIVSR